MVKVKINKKILFWTGIGILIFLVLSYFIKLRVDEGINFITLDSLLGIIIFHNPFVLALYILIGIVLIAKGINK